MVQMVGLLLLLVLILQTLQQTCERCPCPCTQSYCASSSTNTWNSTYSYSSYGYTKLVLSTNQSSCMPCAYSCQICSSQYYSDCTTCMPGFYNANSTCKICPSYCATCSFSNNLTVCTSCLNGTYFDASGSCQSCPDGAAVCTSTATTSCQVGYYSVSAVVCLPCVINCQSCSSSTCQICTTGYYLSSGACVKCSSNCLGCISSGCSSCPQGFYLLSRQCLSCPSNCNSCNPSTPTKCTTCVSGYFSSNGTCVAVTASVANCNSYSSALACLSCIPGTYLLNNQCLPCSIACSGCWGSHFGVCNTCNNNFNLFNIMCLASNFPNTLSYQLYMHMPSFQSLFSGGSVSTCVESVYSGTLISVTLNNLAASSVTIKYKLYLIDSTSPSYNVTLNGQNSVAYNASNSLSNVCAGSTGEMYDIRSITLTGILIGNTLTFSSNSTVAISEMSVLAVRCTSLCSVCSFSYCSSCVLSSLYTQLDQCVYACSNSFYIYETNKSCLPICPTTTFTVSTNLTCIDCTSPCATCNTSTSCLSCQVGYFLYNNTCKATCPTYYYPVQGMYVCSICMGRCLTCTNTTYCLSCLTGFLQGGLCIDNCSTITGKYSNISSLACSPCDLNCLNCTSTSRMCTACNPSIPLLFNYTCLNACPSGYYSSGSTCSKCSYPCMKCTGTASNCTSCLNTYADNGTCVSSCPMGRYADLKSLSCLGCDSACTSCAYSSSYCSVCATGFFLNDYKCWSQCPPGYYGVNGSCTPCISPCLTCANQTFCNSCLVNFLNTTTGECVGEANCSPGYFGDITTLSCSACSSPCSTCFVKPTLCQSCSGSLYLVGFSCQTSCPIYMYPNNMNQCASCIVPCLTCSNSTFCTSCISGYIFSQSMGSCLSYCPSGQYISSSFCFSCQANCLSCTSSSNCQRCLSSFYLYAASNTCVSNCSMVNISYYGDSINSICTLCISPCLTCTSIVDCTSCITGVLYETRCISNCPVGYYSLGAACLPCSSNCLACAGVPGNCTSCQSSYLFLSECITLCPMGYFADEIFLSCETCPAKCSTCKNMTYCTGCLAGYLDSTYNCINSCPIGYFMTTNSTCSICDSKCSSCNSSASNCLSCSQDLYLSAISISSSTCLSACMQTQYLSGGICYNCSLPCSACLSASSCLTCQTGTLLYSVSNSCLTSCPIGTFSDSVQCQICTSPCNTCSNSTNCLTCANTSLFVSIGRCVDICQSGFYGQESTMICIPCAGLCKTCNSSLYCLSCNSGYLLQGYCYDICPPGTFSTNSTTQIGGVSLDTTLCMRCDSPCLTCWQQSTSCLKCINGLFLFNNTCNTNCPNNTYLDSQMCVSCPFPCITCSSSVVCSSCLGGNLLYLNTTCITGTSCPNGLYKMNGVACVMSKDCPNNYYLDDQARTCSSKCDFGLYTFKPNRTCLSNCPQGYYASYNLLCQNFGVLNQTLLGSKAISYVLSSKLYIELQFNQSVTWNYAVTTQTYTIKEIQSRGRLLSVATYSPTGVSNILRYYSGGLNLTIAIPAYYVSSAQTGLPLQTPSIPADSHIFSPYTEEQMYTAQMFFQISQSLGWIILTVSVGFLAINRLSDIYILWDFPQLFYLLIYLDIQYPPNLNQFLRGLRNLHLYFFPNVFSVPSNRQSSPAPFYAQSYDVNFLRGTGHVFIVFLVYSSVYFLLKLSYFVIQKSERLQSYDKFKKLVYNGLLRYRWHYTNDYFFVTISIIINFAVAQTYDLGDSPLRVLSLVLTVVCVLAYIGFPVFVATKLYRHISNIKKGKLIENLKCFYRGIEKTNSFGLSIILLRYLRKIMYAVCIPLLSRYPLFVLPILTVGSFLFALFVFSTRPYKKRISNIINVITQVTVVVVLLLISVMQFQAGVFSTEVNWVIGWICSIAITVIIFTQLFYIFCKTMFYLEPERNETYQIGPDGRRTSIRTKSFIRRKAQEFFNKMFPNLRYDLDLSSQDSDIHQYQEGDSQNSQNNDQMKQAMNIDQSGTQSSADKFNHFESTSHPTLGSRRLSIPNYLVKCVNDLDKRGSSKQI